MKVRNKRTSMVRKNDLIRAKDLCRKNSFEYSSRVFMVTERKPNSNKVLIKPMFVGSEELTPRELLLDEIQAIETPRKNDIVLVSGKAVSCFPELNNAPLVVISEKPFAGPYGALFRVKTLHKKHSRVDDNGIYTIYYDDLIIVRKKRG